jgi:hypothetical protein
LKCPEMPFFAKMCRRFAADMAHSTIETESIAKLF